MAQLGLGFVREDLEAAEVHVSGRGVAEEDSTRPQHFQLFPSVAKDVTGFCLFKSPFSGHFRMSLTMATDDPFRPGCPLVISRPPFRLYLKVVQEGT